MAALLILGNMKKIHVISLFLDIISLSQKHFWPPAFLKKLGIQMFSFFYRKSMFLKFLLNRVHQTFSNQKSLTSWNGLGHYLGTSFLSLKNKKRSIIESLAIM